MPQQPHGRQVKRAEPSVLERAMPWDPWPTSDRSAGPTGGVAHTCGTTAAVSSPAAAAAAPPPLRTAAKRFAFVLGAEECGAVERAALLYEPNASNGATQRSNATSNIAAMFAALSEVQRVSRSADGAVALLTAAAQAQALLQSSDACLFVWRRPGDERPSVMRPYELPPSAPPSRRACSILYNRAYRRASARVAAD